MHEPVSRILLATDGSDGARLAARAAVDLAARTGAELHVAHAWHYVPHRAGYPVAIWTDHVHLYEREARRILAAQLDALEVLNGDVSPQPHLLQGPPLDAILDLCEDLQPGLTVVGSRGMGTVRRMLLGSFSEGLVHHATRPVLVVRGGEGAWPPVRMIVGDDGSDDAGRAAGLATRLGKLYGAEVALVRAHRNPPEPIGGWGAEDRRRLDEARFREEEELERRAKLLHEVHEVRLQTRVVDGETALALLVVAEEDEEERTLLAVGSRGLGPIGRLRLGSVSTNVLRVARGPVLVCPHTERGAALSSAEETATIRSVGWSRDRHHRGVGGRVT